jgi:sulfite reductase (ferredoxin)
MVACTGAATCQLGIARPRGAVDAIQKRLNKLIDERDYDALQGFKIHLSGCPNCVKK